MTVIIEEQTLKKSISETLEVSLRSLLNTNFLEQAAKLDFSPELKIQILSDLMDLFQAFQTEVQHQKNSEDFDLDIQKDIFHKLCTMVISFFDRYSEFCDREVIHKLEIFKELLNSLVVLIEGIEQIKNSELENEPLKFLSQLYYGLDSIAEIIEARAEIFPVGILSILKLIFIQIPVRTKELLSKYVFEREDDRQEIERYLRLINRTSLSGSVSIDRELERKQDELNPSSNDDLYRKQIESNQMPMQLVEFWLREDRDRLLTKEEEEENKLLAMIIDEHRDRKFFTQLTEL